MPSTLTFYGYKNCDTCRKAMKWLDQHEVPYCFIDITTDPPPAKTLQAILKPGDTTLPQLFNRSGQAYRQMNLKDKLPTMSESEAIELLASNGRLCKRPIATDNARHTVGFKPEMYEQVWGRG